MQTRIGALEHMLSCNGSASGNIYSQELYAKCSYLRTVSILSLLLSQAQICSESRLNKSTCNPNGACIRYTAQTSAQLLDGRVCCGYRSLIPVWVMSRIAPSPHPHPYMLHQSASGESFRFLVKQQYDDSQAGLGHSYKGVDLSYSELSCALLSGSQGITYCWNVLYEK